MASFIRAASPIWWIPDLTGVTLNDTYYAFFLNNIDHTQFFPVYSTPTGTPYANPLQFQASGTLPNNLYFDPSLTYCIQIRDGNTMAANLVWEIDNFQPEPGSGGSIITNDLSGPGLQNMITNPQFQDVSFANGLVIATAGTYNIAPGWQLILTGTGSTTLNQIELEGLGNSPSNPPSALRLLNSGWNSVVLQQTFAQNGALFANGAIAGQVLAVATGASVSMIMNYFTSTPFTIPILNPNNATVLSGVFAVYNGAVNLPASTNTTSGINAFSGVQIVLGAGQIDVTNVMLIGQEVNLPTSAPVPYPNNLIPPFAEQTYEREVDQEFHLYRNPLLQQAVPSYLVGWDFPLNPTQFGITQDAKTYGAGNRAGYIWDQTIVFQEVDTTLSYARNTNTGGFVVGAAGTPSKFAIIQYLSGTQLFDILSQRLSVQLKSSISSGTLKGTVSLYWSTAIPMLPASVVLSIGANAIPVTNPVAAVWNAVPNSNLSINAPFTLTTTDTVFNFSGFDATAVNTTTAAYFAIVIAFDTLPAGLQVVTDYCSLMGGDIATRPAPQTPDTILRECQYYYESSYSNGVIAGTADLSGVQDIFLPVLTDGTNIVCLPSTFEQKFKQTKRIATPNMAFYSTSGANVVGKIAVGVVDQHSAPVAGTSADAPILPTTGSYWTLYASSTDSVIYATGANNTAIYNTAGDILTYQGFMKYHYVCDARLGII